MARTVTAVARKRFGWAQRTSEQVLTNTLLWTISSRGLNHSSAIPTHPLSRETPTARPRRSPSHSV